MSITGPGTCDLAQIKSVLVRRPSHYQVDPEAPELIQAFLENEALKGFGGILRSLDQVLWMNDLNAHRAANFKPVQLHFWYRIESGKYRCFLKQK